MSTLSNEELAYFNDIFSPEDDNTDNSLARHSLSVATEIPQMLAHILGNAKLTLLAEISYYQLWFPLTLKQNELGQFSPQLGIPEVIDMRGGERSWRLNNVKNLKIMYNDTAKLIEVLSLSSSGMTIKMPHELNTKVPRLIQLVLPNGIHLDMVFEPVRFGHGVIAAKISVEGESREILRQFLFSEHKAKYAHLYKNINH